MPATSPTMPDAEPTLRGARLRGRPVLLALCGDAAAPAAARVTAALAAERGSVPAVVRAFDTRGVPLPGPIAGMIAAADAIVGPDVHAPDVGRARDELAAHLGREVDWPVHVDLGPPDAVIVSRATAIGAALVVMGLRRHRRVDRVFGDETTLRVMRAAPCPVLGVTPELPALPRCIVVGTDFGPAAAHAARAALDVLAEDGTLVLAHVESVAPLGVEPAFDRFVADLAIPDGVTVRRVRVAATPGRPVAEALLAVAEAQGADVVAVGSRRHAWLDRALLGSVSSELARDGRRALLVAPPPAHR